MHHWRAQLAAGMLGARREGPANAPTSQAAARRCRNAPRMPRNEAHAKCKTFESGSGLGLTSKFNIVWIGLISLIYHSSIMHARYSISFRMSECFVSDFTFVLWVWGGCGRRACHAPIHYATPTSPSPNHVQAPTMRTPPTSQRHGPRAVKPPQRMSTGFLTVQRWQTWPGGLSSCAHMRDPAK